MLFRPKYFVVMGFDSQGNVYGGVVFDSEINRDFVNHYFEDFFLPVPCSKYSFLDHDSFIDCRRMKPSSLEKLLEGEFCGDIAQDDYQNVVKLLKMSPRETLPVHGTSQYYAMNSIQRQSCRGQGHGESPYINVHF